MYPDGLIFEVARRAGLELKNVGPDESVVHCPCGNAHPGGSDDHPSCRLNWRKNVFHCDVCGTGGGVVEFARLVGVELRSILGSSHVRAADPGEPAHEKPQRSFSPRRPITAATKAEITRSLGKEYTPAAWEAAGVLDGKVGQDDAIAFPLPGGGYKVCLYRRPDPRREKPYSWLFTDGGKSDLLILGDGDVALIAAGEWDMLAAFSANVPCVATGTVGEGKWYEEWSQRFAGKRVFVAYDVDAAGREGAEKVARSLFGIAAEVFIVELPLSGDEQQDGKDLSDYLAVHGPEALAELLHEAQGSPYVPCDVSEQRADVAQASLAQVQEALRFVPKDAEPEFKHNAFVKVLPIVASLGPAEQDLAADMIKEKLRITKGATRKEIERTPAIAKPDRPDGAVREPSDESIARLKDPMLVQQFLDDITTLGVVGEDHNKAALLLAGTSRRSAKPANVVVKGESSAGKNHLAAAVLSCFPPEDIVYITSLSPQALPYWDGDLKNKILMISEAEGAERSEYSLRVLQSEGELTVHYVGKVDGELRTVEKTVRGPTATITTTTRETLHAENETRLIEIALDESQAQTERINRMQAQLASKGQDPKQAESIRELWRDGQAALEPLPVVIPFAECIRFPCDKVRSRRDFPKLLTLTEMSAFLHQFQRGRQKVRGREHIVADLSDYALAYDLLHSFLERVQVGLNDRDLAVLRVLETTAPEKLTVRETSQQLGWYGEAGRKRAKRCLDGLVDARHADSSEPKPGVATLYWHRSSPEPAASGISTPDEVARAWAEKSGTPTQTWTSPLSRSKTQS